MLGESMRRCWILILIIPLLAVVSGQSVSADSVPAQPLLGFVWPTQYLSGGQQLTTECHTECPECYAHMEFGAATVHHDLNGPGGNTNPVL